MAQLLLAAPARQPRDLSLFSHALGVAALAGLSFVLIEGPVLGWLSPGVLAAGALTLLSAWQLLRRERSGSHPLLPRELFHSSSFGAANGVGFLINFCVFGQLFLLSLFLQQSGGADALQSGLRLLPMMAAYTVGNFMAGGIAARHGTRLPMLAGLLVGAVMALLLMGLRPGTPYGWLALGTAVMNVAIGIAIPAMTATVMRVAGKQHANSAAAALNANRQIGALVGVALGASLHAITGTITMYDTSAFDSYRLWVVGSFEDRDAVVLLWLWPFLAVGLILALASGLTLNALALGEEQARALGVSPARARALALVSITLLCGASTAAVGPISFVGLVVPHVLRLVLGADQRRLLAVSLVATEKIRLTGGEPTL